MRSHGITWLNQSTAQKALPSQVLRTQEAKVRIYYLRDDHSANVFSRVKLLA
jgi:hypothetical protein